MAPVRTEKSSATTSATVGTTSRSPRKSRAKATEAPETPLPVPTASALLAHSSITTEQWYKSSKTTKTYAGYVKGGKKWLESWVQEPRDTLAQAEGESDEEEPEERTAFRGVFDTISEHTPTALRMLTTYKCDHQKLGFSTAEGLRSAFKDYFERCVTISCLCMVTDTPQGSRMPGRLLEVQRAHKQVGRESGFRVQVSDILRVSQQP